MTDQPSAAATRIAGLLGGGIGAARVAVAMPSALPPPVRAWMPGLPTLQRVVSGRLPVTVSSARARSKAVLGPGDLLYCQPGGWCERDYRIDRRLVSVTIRPGGIEFREFFRRSADPTDLPSLTFHQRAGVPRGVSAILAALASGEAEDAAQHLARALAEALLATLAEAPDQPRDPAAERWRQIVDHVDGWLGHPIDRRSVARTLGISPDHVSRLARVVGGTGFSRLLNERRLLRAQHLLRTTTLPLAEVAVRCGYAGSAYLIRRYRGRFGTTPARDRAAAPA